MIKNRIWSLVLQLTGRSYTNQYDQITSINSENDLFDRSNSLLKRLLLHAYNNVPFYSQSFENANFARGDDVITDEIKNLPLLSRNDIKQYNDQLISKDVDKRKWYYNSTGGSTGDPIHFIQDEIDNKWRRATEKYYYKEILGIDELAVKKAVLWGSARDVYMGNIGFRTKMINWLTNIKFLNSYKMSEKDIELYVRIINSYKPTLIRGFAVALYELCRFIKKKGLSIHQPKIVVSTAEQLDKDIREELESVFRTKVYEFYGSREVDGIAGECSAGLLHAFLFNNYVEVLDNDNNPVREGDMGKLVVTRLHNYSMPLIRYEIGDMAILGPKQCKCGNPLPTLKEITGRTRDFFIKEDGSIIHAGYFIYLLRIRYWIKKFQIIQEDYKRIRILVSVYGSINNSEKLDIENKIRIAMGKNCRIIWEFVDDIPRTQSGKYLFAKSMLYQV